MELISKSAFDSLNEEILRGIEGKNEGIPIGLPKLGKYLSIKKRIMALIFSTTGAGKSAMLDSIILNVCDYLMTHPQVKQKAKFILFSFERSKTLRIAKWLSYIIFIKEGVEIQVPKILGWWEEKLTKEEHNLILRYKDYIDTLLNDYIIIHEGAKTPNEIFKIVKDFYEANGTYEVDGFKKKYTPNDEDLVPVIAIDHINLTKTTKELNTKKLAVDKLTSMLQDFRDLEGAMEIIISQVNRSVSTVSRLKDQEHELVLEDVKESGDMGDASDIAISIFDPAKYGQSSKTGYNPIDFIDKKTGVNYFRSCQILKSSYGADSLRIPLSFNGFCGQFLELPKRSDLDEFKYNNLITSVLNKNYFLKS